MTIAEKLAIIVNDNNKWRHTITGVIESCNIKPAGNTGKDIAEIVIADETGRIKMGIWEKDFDGNDNPNFRLYKKGEKVKICNFQLKEGYNGGDNEIKGLMKDGMIAVLGTTSEVPTPEPTPSPEESPDALDKLIQGTIGKSEKAIDFKKLIDKTKEPTIIKSGSITGIPFDTEIFMEKIDSLIESNVNVTLAIGNLDKHLGMKLDENNTKLLQQFKEFMSKFIESSEVTAEDIKS